MDSVDPIISVNLDASRTALDHLVPIIHELKPLAVAVQDLPTANEAELAQLFDLSIKYNLFVGPNLKDSSTSAKFDVAILVKKELPAIRNVHGVCAHEQAVVGVLVQTDPGITVPIYSVYLRPRQSVSHLEVKSVLDFIENSSSERGLRFRRIILGDFNAYSLLWSRIKFGKLIGLPSARLNEARRRGRTILAFYQRLKLNCLNLLAAGPTFETKTLRGFTDLALVGKVALQQYKSFRLVKLPATFHKVIVIGSKNIHPSSKLYYRFDKITAGMFRHFIQANNHLAHNWTQLMDRQAVIERMNCLTEVLCNQLLSIQGQIKQELEMNADESINYYSPKLKKLLCKLKKYQRRKLEYRKLAGSLETKTRQRERKQAIKMTQSLLKTVIRMVKNDSELTCGQPEDQVNLSVMLGECETNSILKAHFPALALRQPLIDRVEDICSKSYLMINDNEIDMAISDLKDTNAVDYYHLSLGILVNSYPFVKSIVGAICKMSFYTCQTPVCFTRTQGILVAKKDPGKYRIIHQSSTIVKVLERIALRRLQFLFEKHSLYTRNQFAFEAGKDRFDLIARLVELSHQAKMTHQFVTLLQLDIQSAFDSLSFEAIVDAIETKLGNESLCGWLIRYITNRKISLKGVRKFGTYRNVLRGLPQGSPLSPLLWNIIIGAKIEGDSHCPQSVQIFFYADDILVAHVKRFARPKSGKLYSGKEKVSLNHYQDLDIYLKEFQCNLGALGLSLNSSKSKIMQLCSENRPKAMIRGLRSQPTVVDRMEILGLYFNRKFRPVVDENNQPLFRLHVNDSLEPNVRLLFNLQRLQVARTPKEWKSLFFQYLLSVCVNPLMPQLAISRRAREAVRLAITEAIREVFSLSPSAPSKLLMLITQLPSVDLLVEKWLNRKLISSSEELRSSYIVMREIFYQSQNKSQNQVSTTSSQRFKVNTNAYLTPRRHTNPDLVLHVMKSNVDTFKWILVERAFGSVAILVENSIIYDAMGVCHGVIRDQVYYHTIALIYNLIVEKNPDPEHRVLALEENCSLLKALVNYNSSDSTVIKIRERLARYNWKILVLPPDELEFMRSEAMSVRNRVRIEQIQIEEYDQPDLYEKADLIKLKNDYKSKLVNHFTNCQSSITRAISENYSNWQYVSIRSLNSNLLLALGGVIRQDNSHIASASPGAITGWGCKAEECASANDHDDLLIHRILSCKRFEPLRLALVGSRPANALKLYSSRRKLFRFINMCAINVHDDVVP